VGETDAVTGACDVGHRGKQGLRAELARSQSCRMSREWLVMPQSDPLPPAGSQGPRNHKRRQETRRGNDPPNQIPEQQSPKSLSSALRPQAAL